MNDTNSKCAALRKLLTSPTLEFLMEAHNGLSAIIAEEAGFKGLWGSGLTISAQHGVRDNNELSWTQVVDMLELMADTTSIPILLDGDTGYGDFNSMRRLVGKLEQRGVAGVCIEDKLFPKTNSFINGDRQPLAEIEEFQGKIKAGKDSQSNPDFCIVARVEALIAGWGLDEALRRAEAYRQAGADAILIHSKQHHPEEILAFSEEWAGRGPLVIVPTKYYSTPTDVFRRANISTIIWANHSLRACVSAMQDITAKIHATETLTDIEDRIVSLKELFRLQGADELLAAERRYTTSTRTATNAIVLAASRGDGLDDLTQDRPKVMIPIAGQPLLRRLVDEFKNQGVNDIHVVAGYKAEAIDVQGVQVLENPDFYSSGELASLVCASDYIGESTLICYGDLLLRNYIFRDLLEIPGEIVAVVDSSPVSISPERQHDIAYCSAADDRSLFQQEVELQQILDRPDAGKGEPCGRWIGMLRVSGNGAQWMKDAILMLQDSEAVASLSLADLLNHVLKQGHRIKVMYIHGHWLDLNAPDDLRRATDFAWGGVS